MVSEAPDSVNKWADVEWGSLFGIEGLIFDIHSIF